eukprot:598071-Amphidinium_carterae.1
MPGQGEQFNSKANHKQSSEDLRRQYCNHVTWNDCRIKSSGNRMVCRLKLQLSPSSQNRMQRDENPATKCH